MGEPTSQNNRLEQCIVRLQEGDDTARAELLEVACRRLSLLTRHHLRNFPGVKRWEGTDDVLQNALLRLWKSLHDVTPHSLAEFFGLASLQIRRELIDLARAYYGPEGQGAHHHSRGELAVDRATPPADLDPGVTTFDPSGLAVWTEFHQLVDTLPEDERSAFDLLWYQELTHDEAAAVLLVSERTLRRRWRAARERVYRALADRPAVPWLAQKDS